MCYINYLDLRYSSQNWLLIEQMWCATRVTECKREVYRATERETECEIESWRSRVERERRKEKDENGWRVRERES